MGLVGATYPGVDNIERATFTHSAHGITPSKGSVEFSPQQKPPRRFGDLVLTDGDVSVRFPQCKLDAMSLTRDGSGFVVSADVIDRRWKWAFGEIYGTYNVRDKDNVLDPATEKTPAELATLLLEAMGEFGVDVSAVPTDEGLRPEVDYDGDVPAEELAELLDAVGCRVGLDITGACRVWRLGEGDPAPDGPIEKRGGDFDPPEPPDKVRVIFDKTVVQARLELEAVGRDTDGTVKPIDDLSYKPANGWNAQPESFLAVTEETALEYCINTVFRWYRVKLPKGGLLLPVTRADLESGIVNIVNITQILPLIDELVETWEDPKDGKKKPKPCKVYGTYWLGGANDNPYGRPTNSTKENQWELKVGFRVLPDLGVVAFDKPIRKVENESDPASLSRPPAELFVDISFSPQDRNTRAYHRHFYLAETGATNGTGPEVVSAKKEGGLKVYQKRKDPKDDEFEWDYAKKGSPDHLNEVSEDYFNEAMRKWRMPQGESLTYAGIFPVPIDGLNVQASFEVGGGGAATTLSRSRETAILAESYGERRAKERSRRSVNRERRRADGGVYVRNLRPTHQGER